jgi:hypothetical protein
VVLHFLCVLNHLHRVNWRRKLRKCEEYLINRHTRVIHTGKPLCVLLCRIENTSETLTTQGKEATCNRKFTITISDQRDNYITKHLKHSFLIFYYYYYYYTWCVCGKKIHLNLDPKHIGTDCLLINKFYPRPKFNSYMEPLLLSTFLFIHRIFKNDDVYLH